MSSSPRHSFSHNNLIEQINLNDPLSQKEGDDSHHVNDSSSSFDDLSHEMKNKSVHSGSSSKKIFWKRKQSMNWVDASSEQKDTASKSAPRVLSPFQWRNLLMFGGRKSASLHDSDQLSSHIRALIPPNTVRSTDFADEFFDDNDTGAKGLVTSDSEYDVSELAKEYQSTLRKKKKSTFRVEKLMIVGALVAVILLSAMSHGAMFCVHVIPDKYIHPRGSRVESLLISPDIGPNAKYTLKQGFGMVGQTMRFEENWAWSTMVRVALGTLSSKGILDAVVMLVLQIHAFAHATLSPYSIAVWRNFGKFWPFMSVLGTVLIFLIGNLLGHGLSVICVWDEITVGTIPGSMALYAFSLMCYVRTLITDPACLGISERRSSAAPRAASTISSEHKKSGEAPLAPALSDDRELDAIPNLSRPSYQRDNAESSFLAVPVQEVPQSGNASNAQLGNGGATSKISPIRVLRLCTLVTRRTIYGILFAFQIAFWLVSPVLVPIASAFAVWGGLLSGLLCGAFVLQASSLLSWPQTRSEVRFLSKSKLGPLKMLLVLVTGGVIPSILLVAWASTLIVVFTLRTNPEYDYTPGIFRYFGMSVDVWEKLYDPWWQH
eukprot:CAMPEP_0117442906 /NCGR_PEP_ID=MMETSP0759-20121206/4405_1 /TAXON_ID=63605 /ORGANISM="Percolomonas cosmopolitus, Strain WS" /LENGTH=603 /DNA_ID=CAMNT_0005234833 /DNA_START=19 /DNA_END=1830 /DNA_ORIENTATION=-